MTQIPRNEIERLLRELQDIPENERHPVQHYQINLIESICHNYDDLYDLINLLQALGAVTTLISHQLMIYYKEEHE